MHIKDGLLDRAWDVYDEFEKQFKHFIDSLQEEPVNEDLEKVAYTYACNPLKTSYGETSPNPEVKDAVIYGANWQKQKDIKILKSIITNEKDYPTLDSFLNTFKIKQYEK